MIREGRIAFGVTIAALLVALALALAPQWYETGSGHRVGCGIMVAPRNPSPPAGYADDCDAVHVRRATVVVALVGLGGACATITVLARRRLRSAPA